MTQNGIIAALIRDVKQILAENIAHEADLERVAERMRVLVADLAVHQWQEEPGGNIHTAQQFAPLYKSVLSSHYLRAARGDSECVYASEVA